MISITFYKALLPVLIIYSAISILYVFIPKNGAVYPASAVPKLIPISAYLIAGQSLAPSPIIPTFYPLF